VRVSAVLGAALIAMVLLGAVAAPPAAAFDGIGWTSRTSAADNGWRGVAYGNGLFVAVATSGAGNRVMTSPDGVTWTARTSAADNLWRSVAYGNGLFVAVAYSGTGNRVMTSPDGITWTARTSAADNEWMSVAYGNGLFVAVAQTGAGDRVMTSPDGITWTARTSAADNEWMDVAYGNGLFVAVAQTGSGNRVMTSPDGVTWTARTSAANNAWYGVTYGNGLFVAVSWSGSGNHVMTSPDGINWTSRTSAANNQWIGVTYGNGLFVAVANTGSGDRVMTSPDGITWTLRSSAADNDWRDVTYANGQFVAVSASGTGDRVMTNGTWTTDSTAPDAPTITGGPAMGSSTSSTQAEFAVSGVDNSGGSGVASHQCKLDGPAGVAGSWATCTTPHVLTGLADGTYTFRVRAIDAAGNTGPATSRTWEVSSLLGGAPDGMTWTSRTSAADNAWRSVAYGNGVFVAVAASGTGNRVMTSPDGITWTARTSAADNDWRGVAYGNGLFVAVASSGSGDRVMTSPDGITWTARTSAADNMWHSVTYGNGLFVAVAMTGTGNRVMTSPNGITWTARTSAADNQWLSVTYANSLFVAVANTGSGNRVMTSPDGITWTSRTTNGNDWHGVTYANGLFVAVATSGTGNRVMTSPDGITWTARTSAANDQWTSVAYANGMFVAVAQTGSGNRVMTNGAFDTTNPGAPSITGGPAAGSSTSSTRAELTFSGVDNAGGSGVASHQCKVDGPAGVAGSWAACTSTHVLTGLADGTYTFSVRAIDVAGNTGPAASRTWEVSSLLGGTPDGFTWTSRTSAADNQWRGVAYGNGMFVAIAQSGTGNRVMTSPDGVTWTARTSAADNSWTSVAYGNGLFVAVAASGSGNRVMTSPDGINWTLRTSAADNSWIDVTYGNGLFVAVAWSGTGNRVMTSPDGINWTLRTSAADNLWWGVTYGNGLFVAVAQSGSGNRVMTSPDGINWTIRTSPDNAWLDVTYGGGLFVAVAISGSGNRVMTSPDGITWTARTSAADNEWLGVAYGDGLFVAVAQTGSGNRVMTSPDGITWTARTSATDNAWRAVAYGDGMFVAVAMTGTGDRVMTSGVSDGIDPDVPSITGGPAMGASTSSTRAEFVFSGADNSGGSGVASHECKLDGPGGASGSWAACTSTHVLTGLADGTYTFSVRAIDAAGNTGPAASRTWEVSSLLGGAPDGFTWTSRASAVDSNWRSVTYGEGLFVAVATTGTGDRVMTSPDGVTWTARTSANNNDWYSVTYGNGLFVAVAHTGSGDRVMTSPDGITWTARASAADNQWRSVTYGNGLFVAVAVSGTGNRVMTSPDGVNWTIRTSAADNQWRGVTYGNGLFVAVATSGTGNRVMTSPDGITWTARTSAVDNQWLSVAYGNGLFVAVAHNGSGNRVMTSPDGITWTARASAADSGWHGVTYGNGLFVAVAYQGTSDRVMTSPDGITWTARTSATNNEWYGVAYGEGVFVAVSNSGTGDRVMTNGTFDSTDPGAPSISSGPADVSATASTSASFAFSASDNAGGSGVAGYECRLDGGAWASCTSPRSLTSLAEGSHTFDVRAVDNAGNASTLATRTWTVDTTNPTAPSISSGPSDGSVSGSSSASFAFSGSTDTGGSGVAGYECRLDGGAWASCTSPRSLTSLADGEHTFDVRAVDNAGNSSTLATRTWTVDTTNPTAPSISSGPADGSVSDSSAASFAFSGSTDTGGSGVAGYECRLDGGAWASCTSPQSLTSLADGEHTFDVRAVDNAGNTSTLATRTWTVDTTTPGAPSITSGPADGSVSDSSSASFAFSASTDPGGSGVAGYECRVDGGAWASCTSPRSLTSLAEGSHTFDVRALDNAGNPSAAASRTWTVDTTTPGAPSITSGPSAGSVSDSASASFSFSASDTSGGSGVAGYECRLDGGAWESCTSPRALTSLAEGEHTFEVRAVDNAGNTSVAASRTWRVRAIAPETVPVESPPTYVPSSEVEWAFSSDQDDATFECAVNDGDWAPCTSPLSLRLPDGVHTVLVRAVSSSGVPDPRPLNRTVVIDTTAPQTRIASGPERLTADPNAEIALDSNEASVTYECRFDDGAWTECSSRVRREGLSAGSHGVSARAVDRAGNIDPRPVTTRWNVIPVTRPVLRTITRPGSTRALKCDLPAPVGAVSMTYRWYRKSTLTAQGASPTRVLTEQDDGARVRCDATATFASGATRTTRSPDLLVLGQTRLSAFSFPKQITTGRLPTARFNVSDDTLVLLRLWCRDGARRCPRPTGTIDQTGVARAASTGIVKYRRLLAIASRGRAAVSLDDLLPEGLPAGDYKLTIRLARKTPTGNHVTSDFLATPFRVR
jgi:hypothetical protein